MKTSGLSPRARPISPPASVFARGGRSALAAFADANVLVAFDFDGTLAPLVNKPSNARLPARTRHLMCALAARFPVAILSDRRADDIEHRAQGSGAWTVFGHHAMWLESSASEWSLRRRIVQWRNRVSCALGVRSDIWIEDKEFALALHYRGAPHEDEARRAIAAAVDAIDGAQVVFGNRVVTISPAHSPSKPTVLKRILHDFGCHAAIYVGDDAEDEPVFRLKDTIPLLGIRIGDAAETSGLTSFKDSATSTDC